MSQADRERRGTSRSSTALVALAAVALVGACILFVLLPSRAAGLDTSTLWIWTGVLAALGAVDGVLRFRRGRPARRRRNAARASEHGAARPLLDPEAVASALSDLERRETDETAGRLVPLVPREPRVSEAPEAQAEDREVARHLAAIEEGARRGRGPLERHPAAVAADDEVVTYLLHLLDADIAAAARSSAVVRDAADTVLRAWLEDGDGSRLRVA